MATGVGKDTGVLLDDSGGTPRDIGSQVESLTITINGETTEVTGMGGTEWRAYIAGLKGAEVSLTCYYDDTADTGTAVVTRGIVGSVRTLEVRPLGDGSGKPKDTAEVLFTSSAKNAGRDDAVMVELSGTVTGEPTEGTQ